MAESRKPLTAEDFVDSNLREKLAQIYEDAKEPLIQFSEEQKKAATEMKNGLGRTLPQTESALKLLNNALKETTRGTREYFAVQKQIGDLQKSEKGIIQELTSAYSNLNQQYIKARDNAREIGVMHGTNSAQFKAAATEANAYNEKLKAIDAGMGSYQRSVGNYTGALRPLAEILRGIGRVLGVEVEGLREYSGAIIGATHLHHMFGESAHEVVAAEGEQVVAGEAVAATNEEVGASWLASLGPLELVIGGLTVLIGVIAIFAAARKHSIEIEKEHSKAVDGTIILDKKVRDEYNELIKTLSAVANGYKVMSLEMTETQAKMEEIALTYRIKMADITNETKEKLHDAKGFWATFFHDIVGGQMGLTKNQEEVIHDITEQSQIQSGQAKADMQKAGEELLKQEMDNLNKRLEVYAEFVAKMEDLRDENIQDEYVKELKSIQTARTLSLDKIKIESTGSAGEDRDKRAMVEKETSQKIANLNIKFEREAIARQYVYNTELAKLSKIKVNIAINEYQQELFELNKTLVKENASEKEALEARAILKGQYDEKILQINRKNEDTWAEIIKQNDDLVHDTYFKEKQIAQDTFEDEKRKYKRLLYDKEIDSDQYNSYIQNAAQKLADTEIEIERQKHDKIQQITDDINTTAAKNKVQHDINHPKLNILGQDKQLFEDQNNEITASYVKSLDAMNASDALAMYRNEMTEQQHLDRLENLKQEYYNSLDAQQKAYNAKMAEYRTKEMEDVLKALEETLSAQDQQQEAAFTAQNELLQDQAQDQAALQAAGRKNTLAQVQAAEAKAAEDELKFQREQQKRKDAIALAQLFISAEDAFIKAGDSPGRAAAQALVTVLLAKGIATGISGTYFEGTADTGGPGPIDGKGGRLAILHPHEAVISRNSNEALPGMAQAWLDKDYNEMARILLPNINIKQDISKDKQVSDMLIHTMIKKFDSLEAAIKNSPWGVAFEYDDKIVVTEHRGDSVIPKIYNKPKSHKLR